MSTNINAIPAELMLKIFSNLLPTDHLATKLVSHEWHGFSEATFSATTISALSKAQKSLCHTRVEAAIRRAPNYLSCTKCGHVLPSVCFAVLQFLRWKDDRECKLCLPFGPAPESWPYLY